MDSEMSAVHAVPTETGQTSVSNDSDMSYEYPECSWETTESLPSPGPCEIMFGAPKTNFRYTVSSSDESSIHTSETESSSHGSISSFSSSSSSSSCSSTYDGAAFEHRKANGRYEHDPAFLATYRVFGELHSGNFGTVYECRKYTEAERISMHITGKIPTKMLVRADLEQPRLVAKHARRGTWEFSALENEILMLNVLKDTPHVIQLENVERYSNDIYMILKKYRCDLYAYLHEQMEKGPLSYEGMIEIMKQVLTALSHVHAKGIMHRDIKLENILLYTGPWDVVLADFGSAVPFQGRRSPMEYGQSGTIYTNAPEMLAYREYCELVDVWSCGVLALELLTGEVSFLGGRRQTARCQLQTILSKLATSSDEKEGGFPDILECELRVGRPEALLKRYDEVLEAGESGQGVPPLIADLRLPAEIESMLVQMLTIDWRRRADVDTLLALPVFAPGFDVAEGYSCPMQFSPSKKRHADRRVFKSE